jgi:hypothetical protein
VLDTSLLDQARLVAVGVNQKEFELVIKKHSRRDLSLMHANSDIYLTHETMRGVSGTIFSPKHYMLIKHENT